MRAFTDTKELAAEAEEAFAWLESFAAVALRVISKTNPSKVRDCARTEWIKGLIDGKPQVQPPSKGNTP